MTAPLHVVPVTVLEIALACLESAISMIGGHAELSKIARDLEDVIEQEKQRINAEAKA
jgi:hypothetical protein